jgi:hypothetical protein
MELSTLLKMLTLRQCRFPHLRYFRYVNSLSQNRQFHSSFLSGQLYISLHTTYFALATKRILFFRFLFFFVSSNLITSLLGKLDTMLKKCQDQDILNLMRNAGNIKNELLNLFRNSSRVCLHVFILCYYPWSHWCLQGHREMKFEDFFKELLFLDSIALSANIDVLVADENTCEELVETKGPGAQSLVNFLHAVCLPVVCTACYIDTSIQS